MFCKNEENTCCVSDSHVLGHLWKLSKETDRKSVVTLCLWSFYYVKGKLLLMSQCSVTCYHTKTFFPHMTSLCEKIFILLTCGWSRVSITWLHSSFDSHSDHPVVFFWPWLRSNQFYVVWGQQTALDLRAAGIVVVWVLRPRVGMLDSGLQLCYLLLSCFVELFNSYIGHTFNILNHWTTISLIIV